MADNLICETVSLLCGYGFDPRRDRLQCFLTAMEAPIRIMLVDDDSSSRFLMRTILADHPDEFEIVAETANAREAVGLLGAEPQVALLDARMPLMDGYELAGLLLEAAPAIRLVLLSAHVDEQVRARAEAVGIHACLDKGEFEEIPQYVRRVVSPEPGATAAPG
jgi:DNA-binding NarL/FixJ family response regulator